MHKRDTPAQPHGIMSNTSTNVTVTLTSGEWDTIRIALLTASGQELDKNGLTLWREMLDGAYHALKDQTF